MKRPDIRLVLLAAACLLAASAVRVGATDPHTVTADRHPDMHAAQILLDQARAEMDAASHAGEFDAAGHAAAAQSAIDGAASEAALARQ